jgi:hypothetical protein
MTGLVLPVIARYALAAGRPSAELVARGAGPLHLHAGRRPGLGDFTRSGALRSVHHPVCGQRSARWYLAEPDGRALCGRCAAWAARHLDLNTAPVPVSALIDAVCYATSVDELDAVQRNAISRGLITVMVTHPHPGFGRVPLHTLLAHTRRRLTPAGTGVADRAWMQRVQALPLRRPRRTA